MREECLLVQNLMFLTINIDCYIRLESIETTKLISYVVSFENQEYLFSSLLHEHILVMREEA